MSQAVRVVCRSCLRSVELDTTLEAAGGSRCPFCGTLIDAESNRADSSSRTDSADPPQTTPVGSSGSPPDQTETRDWVKTWTLGSLGSLGRFQLRERLGDGGFGEVLRAYDPRLDRDVAIKMLKQPNPSERVMERFFREARAVARLDHPNIVAVHDSGFDDGRCWVAYQLVGGRPLWWYRDHHRMDALTVARVIRALADALDHSHRVGVVHRDIKPANVLIDDQGRPRLIDFGLARRSDFESDLTREGAIVGTPAYMSPEQALGLSRNVDERSDVYSLGVIFYELLHGHRPDESSSCVGAKKPARSAPVPPALRRICAKAIASDPGARHPTARALADELDGWLDVQRRPRRWLAHSAMIRGAAAALMLLLVGAVAVFWIGKNRQPERAGASGGAQHSSGIAALSPLASAGAADSSGHAKERRGSKPVGTPHGLTSFIGNRETLRYHRANCLAIAAMAERNSIPLATSEQAKSEGYRPCDKCRPDDGNAAPVRSDKKKQSIGGD